MTARPNLTPESGSGALERSLVASISTVQRVAEHNQRAVHLLGLIEPLDSYDEHTIEQQLVSSVLSVLQSGEWFGKTVPAYSMRSHKPVECEQEIEDVVIEQIFNHDGAKAHLMAWLASPAGAAAAQCIAYGHAGTNATGLIQAYSNRRG